MGDRANVILRSSDNAADLILYTHWHGSRVEQIVQKGVAHALQVGRNTDTAYAQRIVTEVFFTENGSLDSGTGAGIYVGVCYEPHVVAVDFTTQTVTYDPTSSEYGPEGDLVTQSFTEFVAAELGARV